MKSLSFFKTATFFLLLLNLALIFFLFQGRPKKHHHKRVFMNEVTEILNLDKSQHDQFEKLAKEHGKAIEALNVESHAVLESYFYKVFSENNQSEKDSLIQRFQTIEKAKVEVTNEHFREVKKILRPAQEQYFDKFLKRAVNILLLDKKPSRKLKK